MHEILHCWRKQQHLIFIEFAVIYKLKYTVLDT
jgi:hypothetical protein